jgi:hypothetical protein
MPFAGDQILANHFFERDTYAPTVANGGTATFTTRSGEYLLLGGASTPVICFVNMYVVVNAVGSGASNVTITGPVDIDRTRRQSLYCNSEGGFATAASLIGTVTSFTGGAGAVFDRIRMTDNVTTDAIPNLTGADLRGGMILNVNGFYFVA